MTNTLDLREAIPLAGGSGEPGPVGRRREDRIVGISPATKRAVEQATAAAKTDLPVLITGPRGSGKEFLARAIHAWSKRASGPYEVLNCGALPEAMHAREVLGCAAGVHSLVPSDYDGILARADNGTAVLTQISHLRADVRDTLVRAIADKSYTREGEGGYRPLRARTVVTALSDDAEAALADLPHHRIRLTPLADRSEDVLPLAAHFLQAFTRELGISVGGLTPEARTGLVQEAWPGNVRELRERIRQAVKLAGRDPISPEALLLAHDGSEVPSFKEAKRAFETRYVEGLLRRCGGNISRAARLAKKDRKDFYDVIRRTGVDPSRFRG